MIAWVDLETTGLDERIGHMLEIAVVLTTDDLDEIAQVVRLVKPPWASRDDLARRLDPVVYEMHEKSGLLQAVEQLGPGNGPGAVEDVIGDWLMGADHAETPLAGSTVGFDRRWLRHHMPALEARFSYRSIDVSSLTQLARRLSPAVYEGRPKADKDKAHRALADVRESIEYLRYYRERGFVGGGS